MDLTTARNNSIDGALATQRPTVLVVDDEEVVRSFTRRVLERCGYAVLEAADGPIGTDLFRRRGALVSAVVLDFSMPGMTGVEVFEALRLSDPDVPVVFTTGYDTGEALGSLVDRPGVRCLQKPFSPSVLTETLHDLLEPDVQLGGTA